MPLWAYVGWRLVQSAVLVIVVVSLCFTIYGNYVAEELSGTRLCAAESL